MDGVLICTSIVLVSLFSMIISSSQFLISTSIKSLDYNNFTANSYSSHVIFNTADKTSQTSPNIITNPQISMIPSIILSIASSINVYVDTYNISNNFNTISTKELFRSKCTENYHEMNPSSEFDLQSRQTVTEKQSINKIWEIFRIDINFKFSFFLNSMVPT